MASAVAVGATAIVVASTVAVVVAAVAVAATPGGRHCHDTHTRDDGGDSVVASRVGKYIPAAVLAAALATTGQLWKNEKDSLVRDFSSEVKTQATGVENAVTLRIKAYEELLMGVRGNFESSEYVSPEEFAAYVSSLKLNETHPEILGVSLSYYVPEDELEDHVKAQKER